MWPWLLERVVVVHIPRVYLLAYCQHGVWVWALEPDILAVPRFRHAWPLLAGSWALGRSRTSMVARFGLGRALLARAPARVKPRGLVRCRAMPRRIDA